MDRKIKLYENPTDFIELSLEQYEEFLNDWNDLKAGEVITEGNKVFFKNFDTLYYVADLGEL